MFLRLFLFAFIFSACSSSKKILDSSNPPGTVRINDTLYIDQTEVANIHWREYLHYLADVEKDKSKYQEALPDTLVWQFETDTVYNLLNEYYFRHPSFNYYPVVGISYEQVIDFCKWRTIAANFGSYINENHIKNFKEYLNDSFPVKFYYRLPTKEEWEMVANGKKSSKQFYYDTDSIYKKWMGKYRKIFNCVYPGEPVIDSSLNKKYYTVDVKSFYPNSFGCYNMIGNIAEMILEKGVAKGGSFIHPLDSCKSSLDQHYNRPEKWLGFRCVAVKLK